MNSYRKRIMVSLLSMAILVVILLMPETMEAQCPMCKIAAESNLNNGGSAGKGLNNGIFYMLSMPYIIVGTIAFLWWKNNKKKAQAEV